MIKTKQKALKRRQIIYLNSPLQTFKINLRNKRKTKAKEKVNKT